MPKEETQVNSEEQISADLEAAALGLATRISSQQLQGLNTSETPQDAPESQEQPQDEVQPEKEEKALRSEIKGIKSEIEEIKGMLQTDEKSEIESLKKQIQDILKEDGTDES